MQIRNEKDYINIVDNYSDMLYRIAYQNVNNKEDAFDVVQDVFISLLKHSSKSFNDIEHIKAWLIRITINRCRDYSRMRVRRKEEPLDFDLEIVQEINQYSELNEALTYLSSEERNIVYLHYFEGYSIKEIAHILIKNQNTISSKLTRARHKLKKFLEEE